MVCDDPISAVVLGSGKALDHFGAPERGHHQLSRAAFGFVPRQRARTPPLEDAVNLKRYRDMAIVLLALAVPFWFLRASMRDPKQASGPDKIIIRIATPVQYAAATLARGLSNLWGDYIYLVDVKEDNARLAAQNARLRERERKLEAFEEENRRLRRLLDLKNSVGTDVISAQVSGRTRTVLPRRARHARQGGARLGRPPGLVVGRRGRHHVEERGRYGRRAPGRRRGSGVDVVVQRTGARGFARGTGDESKYTLSIEYVQRTDEVEVGRSARHERRRQRFPKGIPGRHRHPGHQARLRYLPAGHRHAGRRFSRLEEVLVVTSAPADDPQASREPPPQQRR
jgi:rod shape-determining protein MreC